MFQIRRVDNLFSASVLIVSAVTLSCGDDDSHPRLLPDFELTSNSNAVLLPGCEHISHDLCDVMQEDCQQQIFQLMACLRDDSAMENELPPIARLDISQAIARMSDNDDSGPSMPEQELLNRVRGLELLGLTPPGEIDEDTDLGEARLSGVLAYYSPIDREVVLIDRGEPVDDMGSNSVLAHELVHALQDREHDLYAFGLDNFVSSDQELAAVSLVEGEASWFEIMMIAAYNGVYPDEINYEKLFSSMTESADRASNNSGSAFLSARGVFPYTYGAQYAIELWLEGGTEQIDDQYASPPQSTWEILYGSEAPTAKISELNTMPAPLDNYTFLVDDVAGSWVLESLLPHLTGPEPADTDSFPFSARWRGDRFWIYHRAQDNAIAALWTLQWQDEDSASQFEQRIPEIVEADAAFAVWTQGTTTRVLVLNASAADDEEAWVELLTGLSVTNQNESSAPTQ